MKNNTKLYFDLLKEEEAIVRLLEEAEEILTELQNNLSKITESNIEKTIVHYTSVAISQGQLRASFFRCRARQAVIFNKIIETHKEILKFALSRGWMIASELTENDDIVMRDTRGKEQTINVVTGKMSDGFVALQRVLDGRKAQQEST